MRACALDHPARGAASLAALLLLGAGAAVASGGLDPLHAVLLGVVEGVTEYLPVSSTGHLLLVQRLLGIPASAEANALAIVIQAGAILAVLGLYRARVGSMLRGLVGRDPVGRRLLLGVATAFVPAAVLGLLGGDWIQDRLFGLVPVVVAWFLGGLAILLVARPRDPARAPGAALEALDPRMALWIGAWQCLALWPGTSRSLVTIVGGLLAGLSLSAAVEFSFLLGVATLAAATGYEAVRAGPALLSAYGPGLLALALVASTLSAGLAVRWLVGWVTRHGIRLFGWYRVALALAVGLLLVLGLIPAEG